MPALYLQPCLQPPEIRESRQNKQVGCNTQWQAEQKVGVLNTYLYRKNYIASYTCPHIINTSLRLKLDVSGDLCWDTLILPYTPMHMHIVSHPDPFFVFICCSLTGHRRRHQDKSCRCIMNWNSPWRKVSWKKLSENFITLKTCWTFICNFPIQHYVHYRSLFVTLIIWLVETLILGR